MMNFDYVKKATTVTIFGEQHEIPTKTAFFVNETSRIYKEINSATDAVKQTEATLRGIALYLGEEFVKEHFPEDVSEVDTDYVGALWIFLNNASTEATKEVIRKYAPKQLSK